MASSCTRSHSPFSSVSPDISDPDLYAYPPRGQTGGNEFHASISYGHALSSPSPLFPSTTQSLLHPASLRAGSPAPSSLYPFRHPSPAEFACRDIHTPDFFRSHGRGRSPALSSPSISPRPYHFPNSAPIISRSRSADHLHQQHFSIIDLYAHSSDGSGSHSRSSTLVVPNSIEDGLGGFRSRSASPSPIPLPSLQRSMSSTTILTEYPLYRSETPLSITTEKGDFADMIADKYPEEVYGNTASDGTSPHPIQFPSNAGFYNHPFPQSSRESIISVESHWRRRQTVQRGITRRVKLTHGHFIVEYRVPTPVFNAMEPRYKICKSTEFSHMRYTAATCDPDDFCPSNGWTLRPKLYNRQTEILIAVTSYNEDKTLYARTLHGVMLNVRDICRTRRSRFWRSRGEESGEGVPGWKRIVVALVVDGLGAMDKGVLDLLATVGVYQDGVMKKQVDGKDTVAHIFEYTTQLSIDSKPQLILPSAEDRNNLVPVQIILVLKQQNQKKINSHRWVFNALGKQLQPESCILLDAGTKPGYKSIYHLWLAFYHNPHLGGCCGEIFGMLGSYNHKALLNPLVAAQNFEYKLSNILDKPLESTFGYVSVLPGAFSAYRYRAILGRPLEQYFRGDHSLAERLGERGVNGMDIFTKNMFLAEDRILCFELAAKEGEKWTLGYVKASTAETDVPESAAELISQRRRWLNGSFAAGIYSLVHFYRFYYSGHGIIRMTAFHFQALYNILNIFFSWFALANLWLTFSIIIELLPQQGVVIGGNRAVIHWVNSACEWIYLGTLGLQFLLALGNRPKSERRAYTAAFYIFAIFSAYLLVCSLWLTGKVLVSLPAKLEQRHSIKDVLHAFIEPPLGPLVAALLSTFGFYLIGSLLFWDMGHMVHSFGQYLLVAMSFTNVLNVYAFCNLHDVSWGTKGSDKADSLPSISSSSSAKDDEPSVLDTTKVQEDVDASFRDTVARALSAPISSESGRSEKPTADDQNKTFRTHFVSAWLLTNVLLVLAVNNLNGWLDIDDPAITAKVIADFGFTYRERRNVYFAVLLYGTAALSGVRFLGSVCFWAKNAFIGRCRRS